MKVRYIEVDEELSELRANWGGNTNPKGVLIDGEIYIVREIEEHSWHTKYYLEGFTNDQPFNSSFFEFV